MSLSTFDLFSIGIGPSSSHTVGPMRAAHTFLTKDIKQLNTITRITIELYGSLAFTGKGHGTDKALLLGLMGELPESINSDNIPEIMNHIRQQQQVKLLGKHTIAFHPSTDLIFNFKEQLPQYSNGMRFIAFHHDEKIVEEIYYSIGGGFILKAGEQNEQESVSKREPFPFTTAKQLLVHCRAQNCSIADIMMANEQTWREKNTIIKQLHHIADVMLDCINKGCNSHEKKLDGIGVRRRAPLLYQKLLAQGRPNPHHPDVMNWLNLYAMAVNEENAAGQKVVTAPTNGAAGIIPSVMKYYLDCCPNASTDKIPDYLLTAAAIGILYKRNAAIAGAEMGCQGEVGVACSMAAGGLAAILGGNIDQVENAAEIGMEHNLGLTCDPVGGLVQIPCIERNAMGAVKAVNAAQLALAEDGQHRISLDMVIASMREIGTNMNSIYKETSKGGLAVAVNVVDC